MHICGILYIFNIWKRKCAFFHTATLAFKPTDVFPDVYIYIQQNPADPNGYLYKF